MRGIQIHRVVCSLWHCPLQAVSCAGIGSVEVSEVTPYGDYVGHQFKCQSSITYQVMVVTYLLYTIEEREKKSWKELCSCRREVGIVYS